MRALSIIISMAIGTSALAQEAKPIVYNMAISGLHLRSQPKTQSRVITKIPYGTKMEVKERTGIAGNAGWINDEWLKVHFRGRTGYVFAGYLSNMRAPEKQKTSGNLTKALVAYTEHAFKMEEQATETVDAGSLHCYQPFKDEIELETETAEGWVIATLTIPSSDLFDAYILLEALTYWNDDQQLLESLKFVKGKDGEIRKITDSEGRVRISTMENDRVQLTLSDPME